MATSVIAASYERRLMRFCSVWNKLVRLGIATDALVAASTSTANLISRLYTALRVTTTLEEKFGQEPTKLVRAAEQYLLFMENLGLLTDVIVAAFTTARGTAAATDTRYTIYNPITETPFDFTSEAFPDMDVAFGYPVTR